MTKPKQRYIIDLTYIPTILNGKQDLILTHFIKFLMSYLIKKKGKKIVSNLSKCFKKYCKPEQIGSYNDSEFIN